jgi:hypothetical protein
MPDPTADTDYHGIETGNLEMQTKVKKGTRLTGEAREIMLAVLKYKYLELNMPIRALVADTGRSYGAIHCTLSDASVLRSKGGKRRK